MHKRVKRKVANDVCRWGFEVTWGGTSESLTEATRWHVTVMPYATHKNFKTACFIFKGKMNVQDNSLRKV